MSKVMEKQDSEMTSSEISKRGDTVGPETEQPKGATWTAGCSGCSNRELVENLRAAGFITRQDVYDAMLATDRANYVPTPCANKGKSDTYIWGPYADAPQSIGSKVTYTR
uniref:Uncharacterized protein n=1 Tax=Tetraselmis sp. GSL018 TaxID=582737 RepID=A0A061RQA1_9CHLO